MTQSLGFTPDAEGARRVIERGEEGDETAERSVEGERAEQGRVMSPQDDTSLLRLNDVAERLTS